jgi:hypothetical protein
MNARLAALSTVSHSAPETSGREQPKPKSKPPRDPRLPPPGTKVRKSFGGKEHVVVVTDEVPLGPRAVPKPLEARPHDRGDELERVRLLRAHQAVGEGDMNGVPFHRTPMGRRFIEHTVPDLARRLARIADALERLLGAQLASQPATAPKESSR